MIFSFQQYLSHPGGWALREIAVMFLSDSGNEDRELMSSPAWRVGFGERTGRARGACGYKPSNGPLMLPLGELGLSEGSRESSSSVGHYR